MLTMLLGGLWHGASWNFVIWGGYHGALLSMERASGRTEKAGERPLGVALSREGAAHVRAGADQLGVFPRRGDLPQSVAVLRQMFGGAKGHLMLEPLASGTGRTGAGDLAVRREAGVDRAPGAWPGLGLRRRCGDTAAFLFELIGVTDKAVPFVYFQF